MTVEQIPSLLYSPIEDDLRSSVRSVLADHASWQSVLALTESVATVDQTLWRVLADEVGVTGLAIAEEHGGAGASWRETAVVLEELGRAVAPVPFLGSSVFSTALLLGLRVDDLLESVASGTRVAAVVVSAAQQVPRAHRSAILVGDSASAHVPGVLDALTADILLIPTAAGDIVAVEASDPGVRITPVVSLDMTRQLADIRVDGASARLLGRGTAASSALSTAWTITAALLASEQLGVAEWCLEAGVGYLKERRQFGQLIGSYQALQHRCADLWVEIAQARAVARYAAACAAEGSGDLEIAAALAQSVCSEVAVSAAEICVQLHGGIGFTWEFPAHLYLKRAKSAALVLGAADGHRARLGGLIDLTPADAPGSAHPAEEPS
ncbi:unannotated protein [freshwater metagenome]|uniref:Unannotated protein n=1 Tax=freshwater metagenome TaxID=449393 RepID=A0A6J7RE66_9ZZZZ|nr:acyl-CoA dehydrogenase [Actinomycetota bacterium]MSW36193.1 acyl-CoA dehydrogenase [Actinomycetota bacterium]MSX37893.1 acyl-CoA dehydrogenase [Actinomycetota bacterium]